MNVQMLFLYIKQKKSSGDSVFFFLKKRSGKRRWTQHRSYVNAHFTRWKKRAYSKMSNEFHCKHHLQRTLIVSIRLSIWQSMMIFTLKWWNWCILYYCEISCHFQRRLCKFDWFFGFFSSGLHFSMVCECALYVYIDSQIFGGTNCQ